MFTLSGLGGVVRRLRRVPQPQELRAVRQPTACADTELHRHRPRAVAGPRPGRRPPPRARHRLGRRGCWRRSTSLWIGLVPAAWRSRWCGRGGRIAGAWYVTAISFNWCSAWPSTTPCRPSGRSTPRPQEFAGLPAHVQHLGAGPAARRPRRGAGRRLGHRARCRPSPPSRRCTSPSWSPSAWWRSCSGSRRWVRLSGWAFAALTCLATVYLGWHFFVDVLGGFAVGTRPWCSPPGRPATRCRRRDCTWSLGEARAREEERVRP